MSKKLPALADYRKVSIYYEIIHCGAAKITKRIPLMPVIVEDLNRQGNRLLETLQRSYPDAVTWRVRLSWVEDNGNEAEMVLLAHQAVSVKVGSPIAFMH